MMRPSPLRHNLARLRLFLELGQKEMAKLAGCSVHAIQSIELGRLPLSESIARRISAETHVNLRWLLENSKEVKIVYSADGKEKEIETVLRSPDGKEYTKADYENARALNTIGPPDEFMQELSEDYAASFYGQIRAILSSAVKKERGELATWKIAKFLQGCRDEFGHDTQLIPQTEQFGLRGGDSSLPDSPYLKFRQVEAGIDLFREYDREREAEIRRSLQQLEAGGKSPSRSSPHPARRSKRAGGQRRGRERHP